VPIRKPPTLRLVKAAPRRKRIAVGQLTGLVLSRTKFGSAVHQGELSFDDR